MARITDCKTKKLLLEQETGQAYTKKKLQALYAKQLKRTAGIKKKRNGMYNTYHGPQSQEWIDGGYWSLLWYVMVTKIMNYT